MASSPKFDCLIIGSGPSGVACAWALLNKGRRVLMVDGGNQLDRETEAQRVRAASFERIPADLLPVLTGAMATGKVGMPVKLHFGSDYPYRGSDILYSKREDGCDLQSSLAVGGFSTVWGAAILPVHPDDTSGWPVSHAEIEDGYRGLDGLVGVSGEPKDDLSEEFPHYVRPWGTLPIHPQTQRILERLREKRRSLASSGFHFGMARLMSWEDAGEGSCTGCGLCLFGCPRRLIYNSEASLHKLSNLSGFEYRPGCIVYGLSESTDEVSISYFSRDGGTATARASRVFCAAGALTSSLLALRALKVESGEFRMQDSQYFIVPTLGWERGPEVSEERPHHALAQFFLQLRSEELCRHIVHLQGYAFNPYFEKAILGRFPPALAIFKPLLDRIFPYLIMLQGFLHSSNSEKVKVSFNQAGLRFDLRLSVERNPDTLKLIRRVQRKLLQNALRTRLLPLSPFTEITQPGRSFHFGGSFPMRSAPVDGFESDVLGRPKGLKRVHLVDASVLPSIPATTITFTVMANAWRIGNVVAGEEDA